MRVPFSHTVSMACSLTVGRFMFSMDWLLVGIANLSDCMTEAPSRRGLPAVCPPAGGQGFNLVPGKTPEWLDDPQTVGDPSRVLRSRGTNEPCRHRRHL